MPAHATEGSSICSPFSVATTERFAPPGAGPAGSAPERNLRCTGSEPEPRSRGARTKPPSERLYRRRRNSTRDAAARGRTRRGGRGCDAIISGEVTGGGFHGRACRIQGWI
uniref:CCX4 n=1 Tax=Arundo donax TaxID=35708 RepID=A0A0A9D5Q7_ARUDO